MRPTAPLLAPLLAGCVVGVAVWIGASGISSASVVKYGSRSTFDALGSYVPVDWGVFGPTGTLISTPDSRTVGGQMIQVSSSQGELQVGKEGTDFHGDFAAGEHLLMDAGSKSDSFVLGFGKPVLGFGTQIDPHYKTGRFRGRVEVFDANNDLLYETHFRGRNKRSENGSARFVGLVSSSADISYAEFWIRQKSRVLPRLSGALAIDRVDVLLPEPTPSRAVPEPASLVLMLAGLIAITPVRRRI